MSLVLSYKLICRVHLRIMGTLQRILCSLVRVQSQIRNSTLSCVLRATCVTWHKGSGLTLHVCIWDGPRIWSMGINPQLLRAESDQGSIEQSSICEPESLGLGGGETTSRPHSKSSQIFSWTTCGTSHQVWSYNGPVWTKSGSCKSSGFSGGPKQFLGHLSSQVIARFPEKKNTNVRERVRVKCSLVKVLPS